MAVFDKLSPTSSCNSTQDATPMQDGEMKPYSPFPWPMFDIDGGRQSPFEDEDDYDYDSCCGPEGHQWKPASDLVLPSSGQGYGGPADTAAIVAQSSASQDQDMGATEAAPDSFIVQGEVIGEAMLGLRGYKRRGLPPSSPGPANRKPRTLE
eukprot:CAMPEP_0181442778 /NCGR_PEP_ID=MMETSP1110-20121109/24205_1 /TAXON_ID=174948 /ORGANISM="Symbiodinium sp., Strain CCMP421" /LENGTH=151 /DNA_ID=CAMNT_0023566717 /DNA_START=40 /DNA_END=492 /DNA_ORIENTATION=+